MVVFRQLKVFSMLDSSVLSLEVNHNSEFEYIGWWTVSLHTLKALKS